MASGPLPGAIIPSLAVNADDSSFSCFKGYNEDPREKYLLNYEVLCKCYNEDGYKSENDGTTYFLKTTFQVLFSLEYDFIYFILFRSHNLYPTPYPL